MVLATTVVNSCKKDTSAVGLGFIGDQLQTVFTDTTTLVTHTVADDSVRTSNTSGNLLGSYQDPLFGRCEASFFTQFTLSTASPGFGANPVVNRAYLSFAYKGYYGTFEKQTVKVYQLISDMSTDKVYYSGDSVEYYQQEIGSLTFYPQPKYNSSIADDSLKPQLRIPLSNAFGQQLLAGTAADYVSHTSFVKYFKGLYVKVENPGQPSGTGCIMYFDLGDKDNSKISVTYNGNQTYDFPISGNCARFSRYKHDYTATSMAPQLASKDSLQQQEVYVQAMAGLKTKIYLPYLKHYTDSGKIAVNKAELIIRADPSKITSDYPEPYRLFALASDSTGKELIITDYYEGDSWYGGTFDAANNQYVFNIARHVQRLLDGKQKDYGLFLVANLNAITANRVVLGGGDPSSPYKMRLKLTYTKYKK